MMTNASIRFMRKNKTSEIQRPQVKVEKSGMFRFWNDQRPVMPWLWMQVDDSDNLVLYLVLCNSILRSQTKTKVLGSDECWSENKTHSDIIKQIVTGKDKS